MEEEQYLTGYCRCLDASRTVEVWQGEADCDYGHCVYESSCPIAQGIREITE